MANNPNSEQDSPSSTGKKLDAYIKNRYATYKGGMALLLKRRWFSTALTLLAGLLLALLIIFASAPSKQTIAYQSPSTQTNATTTLLACPVYQNPAKACLGAGNPLCEQDMDKARIAWKYFENNYQKKTGLVNAADRYPSTTMWDTGSTLAATIAAFDLGLINQKEFDDRVVIMLGTLSEIKLFNNEAPNKVYNTENGDMVNYKNQVSEEGIGVSTLDLARLSSWLNILACTHPKHALAARNVITRWKFCNLIKDGQMNGLARDPVTKKVIILQEGRLGYEQYAGKMFQQFGFDQSISATYKNQFATSINIYDVPIAYDMRDPRKLGAYNYVVTESYVMDVFEHGFDEENTQLTNNIFEVQKRRWQRTGQVTAVSEDNVDRKPSFVYNTIFAAGSPWNTITDTGLDMDKLKSVSTKAALSMALLYPQDEYSAVLEDTISSAYDPERGWYSGIYEKGLGYNDIITSNTNGVILSAMLFKKYGSLNRLCRNCNQGLTFPKEVLEDPANKDKCLPGSNTCTKQCKP
ncbi:hypothetical protein JCM14076_11660 [Methylosoma difficile]